MSTVPVIAVDGPSGSGKGTLALRLARALAFHLLDSGALYRLAALAAQRAGSDDGDEAALAAVAGGMKVRFEDAGEGREPRILLDGDDVTLAIRDEACGMAASRIAGLAAVRGALLELQHAFRRAPGLVADGRDMGTVVFGDAVLKVFLTASPEERAQRRYKQLKDKGFDVNLRALLREIEARDARDTQRTVAPLSPAPDAIVLDSTRQTIEEVTQHVLALARQRLRDAGA